MKKILFILAVSAAVLLFAGCDIIPEDSAPHSNALDKLNDDYQEEEDESQTFVVTYNGNTNDGGAVPIDSTSYQTGDIVIVAGAGTLTKTSYIFDGWNTSDSGTGMTYAAGSSFYIGEASVILYAVWEE